LQDKSDPSDAKSVARSVIPGVATAIAKQQSGAFEAMRIASAALRRTVKARAQAINQLRALLVSAPQKIRKKLWQTKASECVQVCSRARNMGDVPLLSTLLMTCKP
jgi:hypothetical protein